MTMLIDAQGRVSLEIIEGEGAAAREGAFLRPSEAALTRACCELYVAWVDAAGEGAPSGCRELWAFLEHATAFVTEMIETEAAFLKDRYFEVRLALGPDDLPSPERISLRFQFAFAEPGPGVLVLSVPSSPQGQPG